MARSKTAKTAGLWKTGRRWTAEEAREALEAQSRSGLSVGRFARQEGIAAQRLYWWSRRLGRAEQPEPFVELVPARTGETEPSPRERRMEVVLRSGLVVRVDEQFDGAAVVRLITALEAASC
jgi:transposase-like protein